MRRNPGIVVIGNYKAAGKIRFKPPADTKLEEQDILIGIGEEEKIEK